MSKAGQLAPIRIVFITDVHDVLDYIPGLVAQTGAADLLVVGGDMTNFGGSRAAARVLQPLRAAFARVLAVPGNVDQPVVARWLADEGLSLHGRGVQVGPPGDEVALFGCGASNHTPMHTPFELPEERIQALLADGYATVAQARTAIVVSHTPPRDTKADRLFTGKHVGSTTLRFLVQKEPSIRLCLCGHIHESSAQDQLANTIVVNPGPFARGYYAHVRISHTDISVQRCRVQSSTSFRWRTGGRAAASKLLSFVRHKLHQAEP